MWVENSQDVEIKEISIKLPKGLYNEILKYCIDKHVYFNVAITYFLNKGMERSIKK